MCSATMLHSWVTHFLCKWFSVDAKYLSSIMFEDDTNFILFSEGYKNSVWKFKWWTRKDLPINESKTKFIFFHKPRNNYNFPLQTINIKINNYKIKRFSSIKFIGVLVDEKNPLNKMPWIFFFFANACRMNEISWK